MTDKFPCIDCITLPMCKSRALLYSGSTPVVSPLLRRCTILVAYIDDKVWSLQSDDPQKEINAKEFERQFVSVFKRKFREPCDI